MLRVTWRRQAFFFFPRKVFCNPGGFLSCFFATAAFYSKVRRSLGEVTSFSSTFLSFQMKLFALMSLFFVLSSNHLTYGDEKPKKLQIGVKKRVENCDQRSRRGDVLSMHYTVRIFWTTVFENYRKMSHCSAAALSLIRSNDVQASRLTLGGPFKIFSSTGSSFVPTLSALSKQKKRSSTAILTRFLHTL